MLSFMNTLGIQQVMHMHDIPTVVSPQILIDFLSSNSMIDS